MPISEPDRTSNEPAAREATLCCRTAIACILMATGLGLLLPWEINGESTGYWFFSRLLMDGGGFVTSDRSPIYTVYLLPFLSLPYPLSTQAEYVATTFLAALAMFLFLRARMANGMAAIFSIVWLPFLQLMDPKNQLLALACVCVAFVLRSESFAGGRRWISASYALLVLAALFRPNFAVYFVLMLAYDFYGHWKARDGNAAVQTVRPLASPACLAIVAMAAVFALFPVSHRWNNVWFASTDWVPKNVQSLGAASIIGHFNWRYIAKTYGSFEGHDIYFTHQEAYGGATTVAGMMRANPQLFGEAVLANAKEFFPTAAFSLALPRTGKSFVDSLAAVIAFLAIVYGALRAASDGITRVFVVSGLISIVATSISYPKIRYMLPFVPILALSAWWWGNQLGAALERIPAGAWVKRGNCIAVVLALTFVSWSPLGAWAKLFQSTSTGGEPRVSMNAAIADLTRLAAECRGVMTGEHEFFGAFVVNAATTRLYDIWEIPPFGNLDASPYGGLDPARVDCLFISFNLEREVGMGTNARLRFDNYIKPYATRLLANGGMSMEIPAYGRLVKSGAAAPQGGLAVTSSQPQRSRP